MPERPNIILILADDLGFSDIGAYGSEIETPSLDRLADGGLRFSQFYNCARCCPTRASLLTGLYPHRAGVGHMVVNMGVPEYQGYLNDQCVTIAELLGDAGYRTLMSGKWHVGGEQANLPSDWVPNMPGFPTPTRRGFDRFYGILSGGGSYFNPNMLMDGNTRIAIETSDYHLTDAISDKAAQFVEDASHREEPFFLYLAYTAPHWPLHALEEDVERYRGRYARGWDALRNERSERLRESGILGSDFDLTPRTAEVSEWDSAGDPAWRDLQMAVYAAQIDQMDRGIGRVLDVLDQRGIFDDTLIIFMSDNGGCAEFLHEDGDAPEPSRYRRPTVDGSVVRVGNTPGIEPGPADTFASLDIGWANASNTPFRLFKRYTHEGGIATPCIVHWGNANVTPGVVDEPTHVIDVLPTLLELAGGAYPAERDGHEIRYVDGESFAGTFTGEGWSRREPIYWEHEGNRAVRVGDWKLVSEIQDPTDASSCAVWELYEIGDDRTELKDRVSGEPDRADELVGLYRDWAERCGVRNWPLEGAPVPAGMDVKTRHNHVFVVPDVRLGPERTPAED
ncbi:TPA: arylsulfatase [Candidatus Latescibacteria bacterium]|nr:arylsulfatase [Candidatus Latescibacterota bacterium]